MRTTGAAARPGRQGTDVAQWCALLHLLCVEALLAADLMTTLTFDLLYSGKKNKAEFLIISRTPHTLSVEAKLLSEDSALIEILLRINIYVDANLAEVISYQQEQPVPFFIRSPFSQSEDEKFQQNKILTEWLENIFIHGAIEKKEIDFLND